MRAISRTSVTVACLTSLLLLAGCSEETSSEEADAAASSSTASLQRDEDGVKDDGSGDRQRNCTVEVTATGAAEASWKGKGESVQPANGNPAAYYLFEDKSGSVQVFAGGGDIATSAVVTVDGATYTTPPEDPAGIEASEDGTAARVEATAAGMDGDEVDLVADFTCGKGSKKG